MIFHFYQKLLSFFDYFYLQFLCYIIVQRLCYDCATCKVISKMRSTFVMTIASACFRESISLICSSQVLRFRFFSGSGRSAQIILYNHAAYYSLANFDNLEAFRIQINELFRELLLT